MKRIVVLVLALGVMGCEEQPARDGLPFMGSPEDRAVRALELCLPKKVIGALDELSRDSSISRTLRDSTGQLEGKAIQIAIVNCSKQAVRRLPNASVYPEKDPETAARLVKYFGEKVLDFSHAPRFTDLKNPPVTSLQLAAYFGETKLLETLLSYYKNVGRSGDEYALAFEQKIVEAALASGKASTKKLACEKFPEACALPPTDALGKDLLIRAIRSCDKNIILTGLKEVFCQDGTCKMGPLHDLIRTETGVVAPLIAKHCGHTHPKLLWEVKDVFPSIDMMEGMPHGDGVDQMERGATAAHYFAYHGNIYALDRILKWYPKLLKKRDRSGKQLHHYAAMHPRWGEYDRLKDDPGVYALLWLILRKNLKADDVARYVNPYTGKVSGLPPIGYAGLAMNMNAVAALTLTREAGRAILASKSPNTALRELKESVAHVTSQGLMLGLMAKSLKDETWVSATQNLVNALPPPGKGEQVMMAIRRWRILQLEFDTSSVRRMGRSAREMAQGLAELAKNIHPAVSLGSFITVPPSKASQGENGPAGLMLEPCEADAGSAKLPSPRISKVEYDVILKDTLYSAIGGFQIVCGSLDSIGFPGCMQYEGWRDILALMLDEQIAPDRRIQPYFEQGVYENPSEAVNDLFIDPEVPEAEAGESR